MTAWNFEMSWPPSVNGYWRAVVNKRTGTVSQILSKRGRQYVESSAVDLMLAGMKGMHITARLEITMHLHPPTARKYDVDNFTKAVFDSLTKARFFMDDEQVDILHVYKKHIIRRAGLVRLTVNEVA
ncbi:MAG: hypothetical protein DRQ40_03900 [Gammaproteobacteria bacterium]|nr:MAG: hypothetical protein DRQ40_03900 [Gammaproteobacteria bacterium]